MGMRPNLRALWLLRFFKFISFIVSKRLDSFFVFMFLMSQVMMWMLSRWARHRPSVAKFQTSLISVLTNKTSFEVTYTAWISYLIKVSCLSSIPIYADRVLQGFARRIPNLDGIIENNSISLRNL